MFNSIPFMGISFCYKLRHIRILRESKASCLVAAIRCERRDSLIRFLNRI